jgi:type I restriction-modification system DNA methylase subunit
VLKENILKLVVYDFDTEIDVTILGHIFENSLSEIESIGTALAVAQNTDIPAATVSKRKKDGVFYTPRYITTYIVENTFGKLCSDKKTELALDEIEYFSDKKRAKSETKKLSDKLTVYRDWLLSLTICDPACGSGAFLNAALDFLMNEHRLVDEMTAKLFGNAIVFPNIENAILENNLYGVDINEESVEIARLSLWLRTAKPQRKLNSLNNNIKCGNSLISDPEVAGEKAFDWHKEFPQVFEKGGFDVVIGNPPYVFARENISHIEKDFYSHNYVSAKYQVNTYVLFIEKSFRILKRDRLCGLIIPNSWLMVYSSEDLRKFIMENCTLNKIVSFFGKSFEDANVETVILIAENKPYRNDNTIAILKNDEITNDFILLHLKQQTDFSLNKGFEFNIFSDNESSLLIEKLRNNNSKILDEVCSVKAGLQAYEKGKGIPKQSEQDIKNRPYDFRYQYNEDTYKYLDGADVLRYGISWSGTWLWYGLHLAAPRTFDLFSSEKIIVREITGKYPKCIVATYSNETYLYNRSNIAIIKRDGYNISLKYITAILNSSLMSYYFVKNTAKAERKLFPKIILNDLRLFPIKEISLSEQQPFIDLADKMLALNADLQTKRQRFQKRLSDNFAGIKITGALEHFDELAFKQFLAELAKQKITLLLKQQDEWEEYFSEYQLVCRDFVSRIDTTDKEIDRRVYELYGLMEEEVKIVEEKSDK